MTSANVSGSWKAMYPLDDEGLLTEAECHRLDSWIRCRVYEFLDDVFVACGRLDHDVLSYTPATTQTAEIR